MKIERIAHGVSNAPKANPEYMGQGSGSKRTASAEFRAQSALRLVPRSEIKARKPVPQPKSNGIRLVDGVFVALAVGAAAAICWSAW